jgi:hypothetical protein
LSALGGAALLLVCAGQSMQAQRGILLQGLFDAELWATDSGSRLLARNDGRPAALGRLQLWGAAEPWRGIVLFAQSDVEAGAARRGDEDVELYVEQYGIRTAFSRALVLEGGKILHPVGAFGNRRLSNRNPLIGAPDGYPVQYPHGVMISGTAARVDYRAAAVSLPVSHENYAPTPSRRLRPAVGAGITLATGMRLGASATWGSYLSDSLTPALLGNRPWEWFQQRVMSVDAQVSRGYVETHAEMAWSRYDVPSGPDPLHGVTYYLEAKYTFSPRVYAAARYERNDYPYLQPLPNGAWIASETNMYNTEAGIGYRFTATRLVKMTYRADQWRVDAFSRAFLPDGRAFAIQVSQGLDFSDLFRR